MPTSSSVLVLIADAVAAGIDAESFASVATQPTVQRVAWPTHDIDGMSSPVVDVVPGTIDISRVDRSRWQFDFSVNVFVGKHVQATSEADAMHGLTEEILSKIQSHSWPGGVTFPEGITSPLEARIEINPDEALQERNVWRAVIVATYRTFR